MQLNHCVTSGGLGTTNEKRGYGGLRLQLLLPGLLIFLFGGWLFLRRRFFFLFFSFLAFSPGLLDGFNDLLRLRLGLQMGKLIGIAIEVEKLRNSVRLAQR